MNPYQIINIQEILSAKGGDSYKGEVAVFRSSVGKAFRLFDGNPIYINAFSYVLVLSGSASLQIESNEYPVLRHALCILSPVHLNSFTHMTDDFQCLCLCLHKDFVDRLPAIQIQRRIARSVTMYHTPFVFISEDERSVLKNSMEYIRQQLVRNGHLYQQELIQNAVIRFYLEVDNILGQKEEEPKEESSDSQRSRHAEILQQFTSLLLIHYKKEHTVPFYAQQMNITPQYLTSVVKKQTGRTVNDFIYEVIYCEARNLLLSSGLSIQQIALELNFSDQAAFSKFFKRRSGISPFDYRKQPEE